MINNKGFVVSSFINDVPAFLHSPVLFVWPTDIDIAAGLQSAGLSGDSKSYHWSPKMSYFLLQVAQG